MRIEEQISKCGKRLVNIGCCIVIYMLVHVETELFMGEREFTMSEPMRVLQAFITNDKGGLTGYIAQNYRYMDKTKVQFDFLTYDTDKLDFEDEFINMGAKFYHIQQPSHPIDFYKSLKYILRRENYKVIHFNLSYANFVPVILAKLAGAHNIIIHSHSTDIDDRRIFIRKIKTGIHLLGKMIFPFVGNSFWACSSDAAKWMFSKKILKGNKWFFAHNAIDVKKYIYNADKRNLLRKSIGIAPDTFVIGHIGRFTYQKNHEFLLDIFKTVKKKKKDCKLMLVGDGPEKQHIKDLVEMFGLNEDVLFLGRRTDVPDLLQVMDCFVLPSRFEGLAIVGIEAQAAGIPCVFSDRISREINITGLVTFLSLNAGLTEWGEETLKQFELGKSDQRTNIFTAGYDLEHEIEWIQRLYLLLSI